MAKQTANSTRRSKVAKSTTTTQKKSKSTKAEQVPAKSNTKGKKRQSTKKVKAPEPVPEVVEVVEVVEDEVVEVVEEKVVETPRKTRRVVTRETLVQDGQEIVDMINDEIARLRSSETKAKGVKFLRSLGKMVKTYNGNVVRVTKQRPRAKRENANNSGFLKPVRISEELCNFTGWNPAELKSRVDVTKYICNYIKENDLQNPEDRRQIFADDKLCDLLNYESERDGELKYYHVQRYLKPHFIPDDKKAV